MRAKNLLGFVYKDEPRLIVEVESQSPHLRTGVDVFRFIDEEENIWRSFKIFEMTKIIEVGLDCEVWQFLSILERDKEVLQELEEWEEVSGCGDLDLDNI